MNSIHFQYTTFILLKHSPIRMQQFSTNAMFQPNAEEAPAAMKSHQIPLLPDIQACKAEDEHKHSDHNPPTPACSRHFEEVAKPCNFKVFRSPFIHELTFKRYKEEKAETPANQSTIPKFQIEQRPPFFELTLPCLIERMRPTSIQQMFGQDHLLGPHCVLRSLLDGENLPCIIFWGPPGTGKTSLAKLIARSVSCLFVAFSSKNGPRKLHEILEEAKQAKKFRQRTLVFVESFQEFTELQQEHLLPAIEAGYVVFIGATSGNPFSEVCPALLSRCRIFTLNKLKREHLMKVMERAILDTQQGVAASVTDTSPVESITVENNALRYLATISDGNARLALGALEAAVAVADKASGRIGIERNVRQELTANITTNIGGNESSARRDTSDRYECLKRNIWSSHEEHTRLFDRFVGGREVVTECARRERLPDKFALAIEKEQFSASRTGNDRRDRNVGCTRSDGVTGRRITVTISDAKEAVKKSCLFDNTGEENHVLLEAMQQSMRGGDANAAIYWLARILEGGESSLDVARCLIRFASQDVGLADPQALAQAVASYQACQFLGILDCSVHLAQCAAFLAMAPKSVAVERSVMAAKSIVNDDGQNEPVPLYLWISGSSDSDKALQYLPRSLSDHTFLQWPGL